MIHNPELAHEMAIIQAPYQEVAKEARARNLGEVSTSILKAANVASKGLEDEWREHSRSEEAARRADEIDSLEPEVYPLFMSKDQFSDAAELLGYKAVRASRVWNVINRNSNDYAYFTAANRGSFQNIRENGERIWGELLSDYPIKMARVPVPNYDERSHGAGENNDDTLVLDVQSVKRAVEQEDNEPKPFGLSIYYRLGESGIKLLKEFAQLYGQPAEQGEQE